MRWTFHPSDFKLLNCSSNRNKTGDGKLACLYLVFRSVAGDFDPLNNQNCSGVHFAKSKTWYHDFITSFISILTGIPVKRVGFFYNLKLIYHLRSCFDLKKYMIKIKSYSPTCNKSILSFQQHSRSEWNGVLFLCVIQNLFHSWMPDTVFFSLKKIQGCSGFYGLNSVDTIIDT